MSARLRCPLATDSRIYTALSPVIAIRLCAVIAWLACLLVSHAALAAPTTTGFALDRFQPAEPGSDWFESDSLDFRGKVRPGAGIVVDFSHHPLSIRDASGNEVAPIVANQLFYHLSFGLVLANRLRLAASLPLLLYSQGGSGVLEQAAGAENVLLSSSDGAGIGDPRFSADVRLFGAHESAFSLALGARVFAALGQEEQFASDGRARVQARALFAGQPGIFAYAGHLGVMWHSERDDFAGVPFGTDLTFGAAAGLRLHGGRITLGPEVYGSTVISDSGAGLFEGVTTPIELLFGGKAHVADSLRFGAAAGAGLTTGLGAPELRVVASFEWLTPIEARAELPLPRDLDGDGVADDMDACPRAAGPARPLEPARSGCPEPLDADGDGLSDDDDACPDSSGPASPDPARHGCPVIDSDRDGIVEAVDACPVEPGVQHPDPRRNGCPADSDGDGILDLDDACPGVAGPPSGDAKAHGCPKARIERGEIKIGEQVKFALGSAKILPESDELLGAVAQILETHPEIELVSVEGHTDATGPAALNLRLSRGRAAAVVDWLRARGVTPRRLSSQGFGSERPLDSNDTEAGRRNNRRVEFRIVRSRASAAKGAAAPAKPGAVQ